MSTLVHSRDTASGFARLPSNSRVPINALGLKDGDNVVLFQGATFSDTDSSLEPSPTRELLQRVLLGLDFQFTFYCIPVELQAKHDRRIERNVFSVSYKGIH